MPTTETSTRRREPRHSVSGTAKVRVVESDESLTGTEFSAALVEVSKHGMRLACENFFEEGRIEVWIHLPDVPDVIHLTCEIRWASLEADETCQLGLEISADSGTDWQHWASLWENPQDKIEQHDS